MREYKKPTAQVERFHANVAVARCDATTISSLNNVKADNVLCLNSGSSYDSIFGQGNTDCAMTVCHYVYIDKSGTYTADQLKTMGLGNYAPNRTKTYELSAGYYGCFKEKNSRSNTTTHMGSLAGISQTVINSSY